MAYLFTFTIAEGGSVTPQRGNVLVRSLTVTHNWTPEQEALMKEPETITALYRLLREAREGEREPGWPAPYCPVLHAIAAASEYGNGPYHMRDGGPYCVAVDYHYNLKEFEPIIRAFSPTDWSRAWGLGRRLLTLKRHLR